VVAIGLKGSCCGTLDEQVLGLLVYGIGFAS